jgi:XTP/dITP diphosphohydrolase
MKKIIFATKNEGKFKEVTHILNNDNIQLVSLLYLKDDTEIIEDGKTFEENSKKKAKIIFDKYKIPVIADDSGILVEQLNDQPGIFSARYAGKNATDEQNNSKLLGELSIFPEPHYAKYICAAVYYDQENYLLAEGTVKGSITNKQRGQNGFGYDPLFIPESYNQTMAELPPEIKNKISHRYHAFDQLNKLMKKGKVIL